MLEDAYDEAFYVNAPDAAAKGYTDYLATIDRRLAGTQYAAMIDRQAPAQRGGVLANLRDNVEVAENNNTR